jgi:hypothetical protein
VLARVFAHDLAVGDRVGAADFEHARDVFRRVERGQQAGQHVLDRDRPRPGAHPARGDHHGEALDQGAHHFEREAPRADDDRGPQLDRGHAFGQQSPRLLATGQVLRQPRAASQPAQVDDPFDARCPRGGAERGGGFAVATLPIAARIHGVDQVVRRVHAFERRAGVRDVALDDFGRGRDAGAKDFGPAGEAAEALAAGLEGGQESAPDVARGAGQQDESHISIVD